MSLLETIARVLGYLVIIIFSSFCLGGLIEYSVEAYNNLKACKLHTSYLFFNCDPNSTGVSTDALTPFLGAWK